MGKTPTDLRAIAANARGWVDQLQNELQGAGKLGATISQRLTDLASAIEAIDTAQAKAATILTNPQFIASYKAAQASQLVGAAFTAADEAQQACVNAIEQARKQLTSDLFRGRPGEAGDAMSAFQASQLEKILEAAARENRVETVAEKLFQSALASDDDITVWLLSGGPLQMLYQRLGANEAMLRSMFAKALHAAAQQPGQADAAGAQASLLPHLEAGGSGTLNGLMVAARYALIDERNGYMEWLANSARVGAMAGMNEPGGKPFGDGRYRVR